MKAVIIADRLGKELEPLCASACVPMLPVAGKPVLQYTVEDLAEAGIKDILIIVSDRGTSVKGHFENGDFWGVRIRYAHSRGEQEPGRLISRLAGQIESPLIVARGDVLRSGCCKALIEVSENNPEDSISAFNGRTNLGVTVVRKWPADLINIAWPIAKAASAESIVANVRPGLFSSLDDLESFHGCSLRALEARLLRETERSEARAPSTQLEALVKISPSARLSGDILVGESTQIRRDARIDGPCVIGAGCLIDEGARIQNSVILPNTYVGKCLEVKNATVAGSTLMRIDNGTTIAVADKMLLGNVRGDVSEAISQLTDRVAAATLLLLSTPLWPIAFFLALANSASSPIEKIFLALVENEFVSPSRRTTTLRSVQFATAIPVLRDLPLLLHVVRGDFHMFGIRPTPSASEAEAAAAQAPARAPRSFGLLGPKQLFLKTGAPAEEVELVELEFCARRGVKFSLRRWALAGKAFFSCRAWCPAWLAAEGR